MPKAAPVEALSRGLHAVADTSRPWRLRTDGTIVAFLAVFVAVSRWVNRSRTLSGWDSVLFALATEEYDIASSRPHAPGYPVFVAAAKALLPVVGEANAALVLVSTLASVAAVVLLYGFVRSVAPIRAAVVAAFLFALAPVFLFNGVIALSYTCEAAASVGIAWLGWRARSEPSTRAFALLGAAFALGVGLRPSLLLFLAPVVLWAVFTRVGTMRARLQRLLPLAASSLLVVLLWFIPMLWATGGYAVWQRATALQSGSVVFAESVFTDGWDALEDHVVRLRHYVSHEERAVLPWFLVFSVVAVAARLRARRKFANLPPPRIHPLVPFLAVWLLPSLTFYILFFNGWDRGPTGYILVLLPGLYMVFALVGDLAARQVTSSLSAPGQKTMIVGVSTMLMLIPAPGLQAGWDVYLGPEVEDHDAWIESWRTLPMGFPPNETAILARYSWAYAKWYFPEYTMWSYLPVEGRDGNPDWLLTLETRARNDDVPYYEAHYDAVALPRHPIPDHIQRVVVMDFQLAGENDGSRRIADELAIREGFTEAGWRVLYFETTPDRPHIEDYFRNVTDLRGP